MCSGALQASAETESCAAGWTTNPVRFESTIQYDDLLTKVDPTVHVFINGKDAKMILDTGSNAHAVWDASLIDITTADQSHKIHAHVASTEGQRAEATLADRRGNASSQQFYLIRNSALAKDGYSGLFSPQVLAADDAILIDFEKNCFFISSPFDIRSDDGLQVRRGAAIANPYRVMAIPVNLGGGKIPLVVDSGAPVTKILASLVASRPKGGKSSKTMDVFGAVIPNGESMRLVDLSINGQIFESHPVIPTPMIGEQGIVDFGLIGMDILKNRVIYYDGTRHEFTLITRKNAAKHIVKTQKSGTE